MNHNELDGLPLINVLHDLAQHDLREMTRPRTPESGPNEWGHLTNDDYGDQYDYEILDQSDRWIYYPVCNAATQWAYRFLPEDCSRWGVVGFIIDAPLDSARSKTILDKLYADKLYSDWDKANENDRGML